MEEDSQKPIKDDKVYFFDKPKNVSRLMNTFYALCVLLFALDFIIHRHTYLDWEKFPAFYPLYGFIACVMLVFIAKGMRVLLIRKEDYYDVDE